MFSGESRLGIDFQTDIGTPYSTHNNQIEKKRAKLSRFPTCMKRRANSNNKLQIKSTLQGEEVGGRGHHVGVYGMLPRRCILGT